MLNRIDKLVRKLENFLAITLIFGIVGIISAQVVFRFLLSSPLSWSQEIATFLLIWITVLGMAIAQREKAHIAVNILENLVPRFRFILHWVKWISMVTLFGILGFGGAEIAIVHSGQTSPVTGVPIWLVFIGFSFAAALGLWHLMLEVPKLLRVQKGDVR